MLKFSTVAVALSLLFSTVAEAGWCFRGRRHFGGHQQMAGCGTSYGYPHGYQQQASCASYPVSGGCNSGGYGGCQTYYGGQQAAYGTQQYYTAARYYTPPQYRYTTQTYAQPRVGYGTQMVTATTTQTTTVSGDPYGFLSQLNAIRTRMGLCQLAFGADCYADACQNNSYGFGHRFMGRARRQNSAMGQSSAGQVLASWMSSPGHASALFDPSIRVAAVAFNGRTWTFNAY